MGVILPEHGSLRRFCHDLAATLLCWGYFLLAFVVFFWPFYVGATILPGERQARFQYLNHLYYRGFFRLLRHVAPGCRWQIDAGISTIHAAVVVANHLSYLDPLLMQSLFPRHKTVVKPAFFKVPVFGWVLWQAGYFPAGGSDGKYRQSMIGQMEEMKKFLEQGGVFFIFPEGHRSRDGQVGSLRLGAIKIARLCDAPIEVLRLSGTDRLFPPGRFLFNASGNHRISLTRITRIPAGRHLSVSSLEQKIHQALSTDMNRTSTP